MKNKEKGWRKTNSGKKRKKESHSYDHTGKPKKIKPQKKTPQKREREGAISTKAEK